MGITLTIAIHFMTIRTSLFLTFWLNGFRLLRMHLVMFDTTQLAFLLRFI
jgi:hypothetical protein